MNLKAAIIISALAHVALIGYAHTVEVPEEVEQVSSSFRELASVDLKVVRADEIAKDGSEDPAEGVPNPFEPEEKPEPESEPEKPEPEPKPEPKKPEPEPEPEPQPEKELKSVVTDKTEDSDSPIETDSQAEAIAKAIASAAPVDTADSDKGNGTARPDQTVEKGVGSAIKQSGLRGVRMGTGVDQKKLNQKYGLILHRHISKRKSYPRFARKAGIEGRVLVEITVDRVGRILAVKVRKSSGHEVLDTSTIASIRELERFPMPPKGLTWQKKTFVLPVSYKLS